MILVLKCTVLIKYDLKHLNLLLYDFGVYKNLLRFIKCLIDRGGFFLKTLAKVKIEDYPLNK